MVSTDLMNKKIISLDDRVAQGIFIFSPSPIMVRGASTPPKFLAGHLNSMKNVT